MKHIPTIFQSPPELSQLFHQLPQETRGHSLRVALCMRQLFEQALAKGIPHQNFMLDAYCAPFYYDAGFYHDIGMAMGPARNGKVNGDGYGSERYRILGTVQQIEKLFEPLLEREDDPIRREYWLLLKNTALYHHECWDGGGVPFGLSGEEIPFEARLCAVVNVYDSLLARDGGANDQKIVEQMENYSKTRLDPVLLHLFLEDIESFAAFSRF